MTEKPIIPKIIHQLWIGSKPPPILLMNTWKEKHPTFEYIFWNEKEFVNRNMVFECESKINLIQEINGKADIMRWEILLKYGGIFLDADSICIEPLNDLFEMEDYDGFAAFENENHRRGLVATVTLGFIPQHPLCRDIINHILYSSTIDNEILTTKAWYSVGPALITRFLNLGNYSTFYIFPSYYFLPHHFTGDCYRGHKKVYAFQEWANTKNSYDSIHTLTLPTDLTTPPIDKWISILISSYNTPRKYIKECLNSIAEQIGYFGMEIVWINDGSTKEYTAELEDELQRFKITTRFTSVKYQLLNTNMGQYEALSIGVNLCSHSLIFRFDSDNIMFPYRILHQYNFMKSNPNVMISFAGIRMFDGENIKNVIKDIIHPPVITLNEFLKYNSTWLMNASTMCFYKKAVLEVGNYNKTVFHKTYAEDYALILRFLKKYGAIYNIDEILELYRVHTNQTTQIVNRSKNTNELINRIIYDILM